MTAEFRVRRDPSGACYLVHMRTSVTLPIDGATFDELARTLREDCDGSCAPFDELAGEIMSDAGVLAYDDFQGCYDTPESIAWYEREAALAAEDERELQSWYRGSVL